MGEENGGYRQRFENPVRDKVERKDPICYVASLPMEVLFSGRETHTHAHIHVRTHIYAHFDPLHEDGHYFDSLIGFCSRSINFVMKEKRRSFPSLKELQSCPRGTFFTMYNPPRD